MGNTEDKNAPIIRQFDQVELLTTRRVSYLSDKPGHAPSPHGVWSVVGLVDGQALIAKESALIRIPLNDIRKVSSYSSDDVLGQLRSMIDGRKKVGKEGEEKERGPRKSGT